MALKVLPIPALKDNYIWMIIDESRKAAWVVDPGESKPVIAALQKYHLELQGILITHHHWDHSNGVGELKVAFNSLTICASHLSQVSGVTNSFKDQQSFPILSSRCVALEIPGHTLDHMAFLVAEQLLFCGDTLFSVGCGKIFEGNPEQMYQSLQKLSQLPDNTQVYCGHEYTLANLQFAVQVDPHNPKLKKKLETVMQLRKNNICTLPSSLEEEKQINPFLRCSNPEIIQAVNRYAGKSLSSPVEVFYHLREWKNHFS